MFWVSFFSKHLRNVFFIRFLSRKKLNKKHLNLFLPNVFISHISLSESILSALMIEPATTIIVTHETFEQRKKIQLISVPARTGLDACHS